MILIIIYDFEVFPNDWLVCWLDTETRKNYHIVNDKALLEKFYEHYKNTIWIGYNSRGYDQWIAKAILCGFNPYLMSVWIIERELKGYQFSQLLNKFPIINYDCIVGFRSLKELEGFMGHDIVETSIPFNIQRKLTPEEIKDTIKYCTHDVNEAFEVFVETKTEFESHMGLIKEFGLDFSNVSKTKAQISARILGAVKKEHNDEFDIRFPDTLNLGKYTWIRDWYLDWATHEKNYETMALKTEVFGVPHTFGIGGIHGSRDNYFGDGYYLMADVSSYYPAMMIEYDFLSRNVYDPTKYRKIRDDRIAMKKVKDPREYPRKIVLNATFGASKDPYNNLYDPLQANNLCIAGQLFLLDLLDKLEIQGKCELIQSNTDGLLLKLFRREDKEEVMKVCDEWCARTRLDLEFEEYSKVVQRDVNNYIIIPFGELYDSKGKERFKRKGSVVKKLNPIDNDLPIVNKAVVDYFLYNTPVEQTVMACDSLIMFQKITKIGGNYEYALHNGNRLSERVNRCFASKSSSDGTLYKKHKLKKGFDKVASVPDKCFIENNNIVDKKVYEKLDKYWYIEEAKRKIKEFI